MSAMNLILSASTSQFIFDLPLPSGTTFSSGTTQLLEPIGDFSIEDVRDSSGLQTKIDSGDVKLLGGGHEVVSANTISINYFVTFGGQVFGDINVEGIIASGGTDILEIFDNRDDFTTGSTLIGSTVFYDRINSLSAYTTDLSPLLDDTNSFTTGSTLIGSTAFFDRTDILSAYTLDLSTLVVSDIFVTGSTLSGGTNLVLTRNDAVEIVQDLSSFLDDTDIYVTGGTFSSSASTITLTRNDGNDVVVTGFTSGSGFTGYEYAEDETNSNTTSSSYQEKLKLTTSSLAAGDYRIGWSTEVAHSDGDKRTHIRVQVDDTTTINEIAETPKFSDQYTTSSGFRRLTLTSAVHTIDIDWRANSDDGGTARIRRARIEIWKV